MLSMALISLATSGLTLVAQADLPVQTNSTYVQKAVYANENDSIAFELHVPTAQPEVVVVRFDATSKTIKVVPGVFGFQEDCGIGVLTVIDLATHVNTHFSVATGKPLSQQMGTVERVGRLAVERYNPMEDVAGNDEPRVFDVLDGKELTTIGRSWDHEKYMGEPAWDDGILRMFGARRSLAKDKYSDGVTIFRTKGYTFEKGDSVNVTEYAFGFNRIVGNPSKGVFAAAYSSNRWVYYTTLTKDLKRTHFQVDVVRDISDKGVLGKMITHTPEYGDPTLGPLGCWDPMTGKKLWQLEHKGEHRAIWLDKYALVGNQLRDPVTGETVHTLPDDRMFVAASGNTIWLATNSDPRKLEVWKVN